MVHKKCPALAIKTLWEDQIMGKDSKSTGYLVNEKSALLSSLPQIPPVPFTYSLCTRMYSLFLWQVTNAICIIPRRTRTWYGYRVVTWGFQPHKIYIRITLYALILINFKSGRKKRHEAIFPYFVLVWRSLDMFVGFCSMGILLSEAGTRSFRHMPWLMLIPYFHFVLALQRGPRWQKWPMRYVAGVLFLLRVRTSSSSGSCWCRNPADFAAERTYREPWWVLYEDMAVTVEISMHTYSALCTRMR